MQQTQIIINIVYGLLIWIIFLLLIIGNDIRKLNNRTDFTSSVLTTEISPKSPTRENRANNTVELHEFFQAIGEVESGNTDGAVGDGGDSLGRYQIQRPYWADAVEFNPRLRDKDYEDLAQDYYYGQAIMIAYFKRYAPEIDLLSGSISLEEAEKLARVHNGGPVGLSKKATLPYWEKVREQLERNQ